jgi:hypothetical protein
MAAAAELENFLPVPVDATGCPPAGCTQHWDDGQSCMLGGSHLVVEEGVVGSVTVGSG